MVSKSLQMENFCASLRGKLLDYEKPYVIMALYIGFHNSFLEKSRNEKTFKDTHAKSWKKKTWIFEAYAHQGRPKGL